MVTICVGSEGVQSEALEWNEEGCSEGDIKGSGEEWWCLGSLEAWRKEGCRGSGENWHMA